MVESVTAQRASRADAAENAPSFGNSAAEKLAEAASMTGGTMHLQLAAFWPPTGEFFASGTCRAVSEHARQETKVAGVMGQGIFVLGTIKFGSSYNLQSTF